MCTMSLNLRIIRYGSISSIVEWESVMVRKVESKKISEIDKTEKTRAVQLSR